VGASDELLIECHQRAADGARRGFSHCRIFVCGALGVVDFQPGGLWYALVHSLNADHATSIAATKLNTPFEFQQLYSTLSYRRRSWEK
jgi:hypothetical protein